MSAVTVENMSLYRCKVLSPLWIFSPKGFLLDLLLLHCPFTFPECLQVP